MTWLTLPGDGALLVVALFIAALFIATFFPWRDRVELGRLLLAGLAVAALWLGSFRLPGAGPLMAWLAG